MKALFVASAALPVCLSFPALAQVTSFNGRTGVVVPTTGDYTCSQVTNCGPTNGANTWSGFQAFSAGSLILNNGTANIVNWGNVGVGAPTFTTRSAGTKAVFYNTLDASHSDYAAGVEVNYLWFSAPTTNDGFKWYLGTTNVATLSGVGLWRWPAYGAGTAYFDASGNISSASASTMRTNLGLGTAALENTGTSGATIPLNSTANTFSNVLTINRSQSGGTIANVLLQNTGTPASGNAVNIESYPSGFGGGGFMRLEAYRDGANNSAGLQVYTTNAGVATPKLTLDKAGAFKLDAYTAGLLRTDGSGNVTSDALAQANTWTAGQTISAASGSGGVTFNNSSRSRSWSVRPVNSSQDAVSTDLEIYSNTGNGYAGRVGFFAGYDGRLVVGRNAVGVPNARQYNSFQAVGPYAGENNGFEAMAFDGWQQVSLTRYDTSGGVLAPVGDDKQLGVYCFSAFSNPSTNCVSGLFGYTTEAQVQGSNEGASVSMFYTPNGSTGLLPGVTVSAGGTGGVSIGASAGTFPSQVPTDLGNGTVHARSDIATQGHFRGTGSAPTSSSCGGTVTFGAGATDNGGIVSTGSSCSTVVVNFNAAYAQNPACIVQVYANASPTAYVSSISTTSFTVTLTSALNGAFTYICMGAG